MKIKSDFEFETRRVLDLLITKLNFLLNVISQDSEAAVYRCFAEKASIKNLQSSKE